ncbi:coiled-coil domain-containing protein 174 [Calliopsis andreniformis]|uniref:coiled-coil domain-containing protein 174 n=1 Tax=Calliopsis andreniformis TaxID=337506 RepID=UPI003FCC6A5C
MNTTKKINVNFSSLVGLKAELLRKQIEVNEAKSKSETNYPVPKVKVKKKSKKVKKTNDENEEKSEYIEDVNTHKKSKLMLEAKTRLYEQLKKSKNNNDNFLVDFINKSDESEEELEEDNTDENDTTLLNEDEWIEYEDCFGRTRKCLREDLPLMQEKDNLIKQQIITKQGVDPKTKDSIKQKFVEEKKEPEIEIMRRKWEEQTKKLADKANIHYQDVLFDEARAHGVGYYAFSQNEEERIKQQENLSNLRKETEHKQKEIKELKEIREKMEQNRLKAARIRQRIRAGLPIEPMEEELEQKDDTEFNPNASEISEECIKVEDSNKVEENDDRKEQKTEEEKAIERENKIRALGELLGKRNYWYEMSQEEWIHKRRKIRDNEFGPVYDNFRRSGYLNPKVDNTALNIQNDKKLVVDTGTNNHHESQTENETSIDSYDIPLPPNPPASYCNIEDPKSSKVERSNNQNDLQHTISITHHESNTVVTTSSTTMQNQIKSNKSIDEASIAAGLRYLREKFEKSQNT